MYTKNSKLNEEEDEDSWFHLGSSIDRAISAPPVMDSLDARLSSSSIFAFQSRYSHLFGDIRYEDGYEKFYNNHNDPSKLPEPISYELFENGKKKKEDEVLQGMSSLKFGDEPYTKMEKLSPSTTLKNNGTIGQELKLSFSSPKTKTVSGKNLPEYTSEDDEENEKKKNPKKERSTTPNGTTISETNSNLSSPREVLKSPRSKAIKYTSIQEVIGKIYALSKDQYGCRFLQKKLEENKPEEIEIIFSEIFENIVELMTDPFGNYLCQKLLEYVDERQKTLIIKAVSNDLISIATNMHGTRAVQKLTECLSSPEHVKLITISLKANVVTLIRDLNGNHVIQRCLQKLSNNDKQFIYDAITGKCVQVATHKHGCCVLQRSIDYASEKQKKQLVNEIIVHALQLVQDPFGNYVVQYVLDLAEELTTIETIKKFLGSIDTLSTNKFSSNVIEQCIRLSPLSIRSKMIDEILASDKLGSILQDSFGNYVIQTAIGECDTKQFAKFNEVLKPFLHTIKNTPYGKKIESKLQRTNIKRTGDTKQFSKTNLRGKKTPLK